MARRYVPSLVQAQQTLLVYGISFCYVRIMSENIQSAMFEILKRIQTDIGDVKSRLGGVENRLGGLESRVGSLEQRVSVMDARMERMEQIQRRMRRDNAAVLVMMRGAAALFDERLTAIEEDVKSLKRGRL